MAEKLRVIKARMKAAQDRQKSYADKRRRPIEFDVGDRVLLKVSPWKGIIRFRRRGKLSPRYIGPFQIKARVGKVAYRLDLPEELNGIRPTFHVSHLRKCLADELAYVPLDDIEIDDRLNYIEEPVAIVDTKEKQLRNKMVRQVRVQWKHRKGSDTTWETEDEMRKLEKKERTRIYRSDHLTTSSNTQAISNTDYGFEYQPFRELQEFRVHGFRVWGA
ncbi:hypothetical protein E3N88_41254 [Mikania micrantha]|uniref:Tf2-1-like SH3-like domain-containing protein n=1 Tax=Mikania micrantha TaxID=192012 RepID=A0A5N6LQ19_9ASTR|nr:hypothetical protein E3N88_41254 [Mikania micrantha]